MNAAVITNPPVNTTVGLGNEDFNGGLGNEDFNGWLEGDTQLLNDSVV